MRRTAILLLACFEISACAPSAPSAAPSAPAARTSAAAPTVAPSAGPSAAPTNAQTAPTITAPPPPSGTLAWPNAFDVELEVATYWSEPPFRIPFSIAVIQPGWYSAHVHEDFFDLLRFDGVPHQFPTRMVGFADPDQFRGDDGNVAVEGLSPDDALDLLARRASLETTNRSALDMFGIRGARIDLHSGTDSNPIFGTAEGNFGLGPELDMRLVLLPRGGRLFVVVVLAAPGDLDAAWEQALPILETVRL
jgi:hypothetical protein